MNADVRVQRVPHLDVRDSHFWRVERRRILFGWHEIGRFYADADTPEADIIERAYHLAYPKTLEVPR